jgi:POT family proton-dependent oligopeptide transporter
MPPGIPWIIGNEAAERFSFYGMRTILVVFMAKYLFLLDGRGGIPMSEAAAVEHYHTFVGWVYFTPLLGALLSDIFLGKYRTIILLSVVYCLGHAALACMGNWGNSPGWLLAGLLLICLGSGGIKPCVSAHVGDQFGSSNRHLLSRIYNWFYFSINLGSFVSTLLTPWLLEWYGPHWAFGVPGVLMAVATVLFWMGRHKFVHVPPGGMKFFRELFSSEGLIALAKLIPLFLFIAVFWSLYDQTGSSWVFQAGQMDLHFLGVRWLESQIQAVNPILILIFIPLFALVIYPLVQRVFTLTPLRKIGIGFFLAAASFALTALVQSWIDAGRSPSIGWQFLCYILITAAEIMISIVGLEFSYTQAPRNLKSMIMSLYLLSVFAGNMFTAAINRFIQIPGPASEQCEAAIRRLPTDWQKDPRTIMLPGYDGITGTADDFIQTVESGKPTTLILPGQPAYNRAADTIEEQILKRGGKPPDAPDLNLKGLGIDPWGNPIRCEILNSSKIRVISNGPDHAPGTRWDQGMLIDINRPSPKLAISWTDRFHPQESWLSRRISELGGNAGPPASSAGITFTRTTFSGGQTKLQGADYFRFFMWLMLGTTVAFIPFAAIYRPKSYLQE